MRQWKAAALETGTLKGSGDRTPEGLQELMKFPDKWRIRSGAYASLSGEDFGAFIVPGPCGRELKVLASSGDESLSIEWEHVSVSLSNRCPNWEEMCFIKATFWDDEETVMELHPPKSKWINNHPYCLHLWRPKKETIPLPPNITVGKKEPGTLI